MKRSRRHYLVSLAGLLLIACSDSEIIRHAGTKADPWLIGMSQCTLTEPWRVQMNEDIKKAAEAYSDRMKVLFKDAEDKNTMQRAQVAELVAQGIDCLIISPRETGPCKAVVKSAFKRGIKVIVLDREIGHRHYDVFIGGDNLRIGRAAGEWARTELEGKGVIVELTGNMTSSPAQLRQRGFWQGLDTAKHPGLKIVGKVDTDWKQEKAHKEMRALLATLDQIDLVYGHNDPAAYGAFLAAQESGRADFIKFIGIDALPHEGIEWVRRNVLDATFLYPTGGKDAIETAVKLLEDKHVPKVIKLRTRVYDAGNVEDGGEEIR